MCGVSQQRKKRNSTVEGPGEPGPRLLRFPVAFLAVALARQRRFGATLFAWLEIVGVALDLFDDVFSLDLALESAESTLESLALLHVYFSQFESPPHYSDFRPPDEQTFIRHAMILMGRSGEAVLMIRMRALPAQLVLCSERPDPS